MRVILFPEEIVSERRHIFQCMENHIHVVISLQIDAHSKGGVGGVNVTCLDVVKADNTRQVLCAS